MINSSYLLMFAYTAFSVNSNIIPFLGHRLWYVMDFSCILDMGQLVQNQSVKLDLTLSIGFILYFLIDGKWFGSFAHLCLFSLHKVHISLPRLKAEEHARIVLTPHLLEILSILCDVFWELLQEFQLCALKRCEECMLQIKVEKAV